MRGCTTSLTAKTPSAQRFIQFLGVLCAFAVRNAHDHLCTTLLTSTLAVKKRPVCSPTLNRDTTDTELAENWRDRKRMLEHKRTTDDKLGSGRGAGDGTGH
jgi:hypothetical protein